MIKNPSPTHLLCTKKTNRAALITLLALFGTFGIWSFAAQISNSISIQGAFAATNGTKIVQGAISGKVLDVLVQENELVKEGQLLIQLDPALIQNEFESVKLKRFQALAELDRLKAERDDANEIEFQDELELAAKTEAEVANILNSQSALFMSAQQSHRNQLELFHQHAKNAERATETLNLKLANLTTMKAHSQAEVNIQHKLLKQGLTTRARFQSESQALMQLEQEVLSVKERLDTLSSEQEQNELDRQTYLTRWLHDLQQKMTAANDEISAHNTKLSELELRLAQLRILSPADGRVFQLSVLSKGQVTNPSQELLQVVPADQASLIKAKIRAQDIHEIHKGQSAEVSLITQTAANQIKLPATVQNVGADTVFDGRSTEGFYELEISLAQSDMDQKMAKHIRPGAPVTVHLLTGSTTPLGYFMSPITNFTKNALN